MITRTVKAQLLAFATVTAVGVSYVGAQYTGLADMLLDRGYTVRAEFTESEASSRGRRSPIAGCRSAASVSCGLRARTGCR